MPSVTACLIVKDEAPYLVEWIAHYLALGFDRLTIYDNESSDATSAMLAQIRAMDARVESCCWPNVAGQVPQFSAYRHALDRATTTWIAFFDADELLVLNKHDSIQEFLLQAPASAGATAINWMIFGSSGETSYRDELQATRFRRGNGNRHVKSIARVAHARSPWAHSVQLADGYHYCNDRWQQIELKEGCKSPNYSCDVAQLNHYVVRSAEEFAAKVKRGYVAAAPGEVHRHPRDAAFWSRMDQNDKVDSSIDRWVRRSAPLRAVLRDLPALKPGQAAPTGRSTSMILSPERLAGRFFPAAPERAFNEALGKLPRSPAAYFPLLSVGDALVVQNSLLLLAGSIRRQPARAAIEQASALIAEVAGLQLAGGDEMILACLLTGLVAFEDIAGNLLAEPASQDLLGSIDRCAGWLDEVCARSVISTVNSPGLHAWNHSVVCSLALAMCGLRDPTSSINGPRIEFGMRKLEKFLQHGITASGIPYEGLFYWGLCLRAMGLFGLLVEGDRSLAARYRALREHYSDRLDRVLDWMDGALFPGGKYLLSHNHSPYTSYMALNGLLLFFGDRHPDKCASLWSRLTGESGDGLNGNSPQARDSCVFEGLFFLPARERQECPFQCTPIVDMVQGWALLQSGRGDVADKLLVKSSRHLSGLHNQSDANHFSAFLGGNPLFIDAGAAHKIHVPGHEASPGSDGTYRLEGSGASSFGHNAIIIDGKGQVPSGDGVGVSGALLRCNQVGDAWIVSASAKSAYDTSDYNPVAHAVRHLVFCPGALPFLFVFDDIQAQDGQEHTFDRLLQMPHVVDLATEGPQRALRLRFEAKEFEVRLVSGAVSATTLDTGNRTTAHPFKPMTTVRDRVVAVNPYFWLLATLPGDTTTVSATHSADHWAFELRHADARRSIRIPKWQPGQAPGVQMTVGSRAWELYTFSSPRPPPG
ncbi:MAG: glycosyltransferase family 2 protein [Pseudomonadota bacterium]|nr:glycosyltransferase family 2 protein [Pseudomonadota bacterium]